MPVLHKVQNVCGAITENPFPFGSARWWRYALLRTHLGANRYANLLRLIVKHRCRTFVEVGTHDGRNAVRMIEAARLAGSDPITYFGFDLFEDFKPETLQQELSLVPPAEAEVRALLEATGAHVTLFRGDSRIRVPEAMPLLRQQPLDLIFIDGGHSVETTLADWSNLAPLVSPTTIVLFDDYYINPVASLRQFGCNEVVDRLDPTKFAVSELCPSDRFIKDYGVLEVAFREVRLRSPVTGPRASRS